MRSRISKRDVNGTFRGPPPSYLAPPRMTKALCVGAFSERPSSTVQDLLVQDLLSIYVPTGYTGPSWSRLDWGQGGSVSTPPFSCSSPETGKIAVAPRYVC
jgi:hypothetical protein